MERKKGKEYHLFSFRDWDLSWYRSFMIGGDESRWMNKNEVHEMKSRKIEFPESQSE